MQTFCSKQAIDNAAWCDAAEWDAYSRMIDVLRDALAQVSGFGLPDCPMLS